MKPRDLITDSVLTDAEEVDSALRQSGQDDFSIANTLRLIKEVDTDELRRLAKNIWGTGGTEGGSGSKGDLVSSSTGGCVEKLWLAHGDSKMWTGEANNAYAQRLKQVINSIEDQGNDLALSKLATDIGQALENMADAWDRIFGSGPLGEILTWVGIALSAIGIIISMGLDFSIIGIPAGIILGILSVLVGAVSIWWGSHAAEQKKVEVATTACADAQRVTQKLESKEP